MTLTAANVRVGVTGAVYVAATTATAPTNSTSSWDAAFTDLGYVSEDGVTESYDDTTKEIHAWQGGILVRRLISATSATFHFTLIETKRQVLELFHKGSVMTVPTAGNFKLDVLAPAPDHRSFGLDVVDGSKITRIYIPDGEVTDRGDIVYKSDEAIGFEITVTAYPVSNVVCTKFSTDTAWALS